MKKWADSLGEKDVDQMEVLEKIIGKVMEKLVTWQNLRCKKRKPIPFKRAQLPHVVTVPEVVEMAKGLLYAGVPDVGDLGK